MVLAHPSPAQCAGCAHGIGPDAQLRARAGRIEANLSDALAFVPRALFGAYLAEQLDEAIATQNGKLQRVRGEVVRVDDHSMRFVRLADGRRIEGDHVVLATGNLPPKPPRCRDHGV
ncbi:FAD/NAD(P)-binding protein [Xanthobacter sp. ZOL 2024]